MISKFPATFFNSTSSTVNQQRYQSGPMQSKQPKPNHALLFSGSKDGFEKVKSKELDAIDRELLALAGADSEHDSEPEPEQTKAKAIRRPNKEINRLAYDYITQQTDIADLIRPFIITLTEDEEKLPTNSTKTKPISQRVRDAIRRARDNNLTDLKAKAVSYADGNADKQRAFAHGLANYIFEQFKQQNSSLGHQITKSFSTEYHSVLRVVGGERTDNIKNKQKRTADAASTTQKTSVPSKRAHRSSNDNGFNTDDENFFKAVLTPELQASNPSLYEQGEKLSTKIAQFKLPRKRRKDTQQPSESPLPDRSKS